MQTSLAMDGVLRWIELEMVEVEWVELAMDRSSDWRLENACDQTHGIDSPHSLT